MPAEHKQSSSSNSNTEAANAATETPSLLSVVMKNPLRQGLQWAGERDAYSLEGDEAGGAGQGGLVSVLIRLLL
jgi:hypothetical protein